MATPKAQLDTHPHRTSLRQMLKVAPWDQDLTEYSQNEAPLLTKIVRKTREQLNCRHISSIDQQSLAILETLSLIGQVENANTVCAVQPLIAQAAEDLKLNPSELLLETLTRFLQQNYSERQTLVEKLAYWLGYCLNFDFLVAGTADDFSIWPEILGQQLEFGRTKVTIHTDNSQIFIEIQQNCAIHDLYDQKQGLPCYRQDVAQYITHFRLSWDSDLVPTLELQDRKRLALDLHTTTWLLPKNDTKPPIATAGYQNYRKIAAKAKQLGTVTPALKRSLRVLKNIKLLASRGYTANLLEIKNCIYRAFKARTKLSQVLMDDLLQNPTEPQAKDTLLTTIATGRSLIARLQHLFSPLFNKPIINGETALLILTTYSKDQDLVNALLASKRWQLKINFTPEQLLQLLQLSQTNAAIRQAITNNQALRERVINSALRLCNLIITTKTIKERHAYLPLLQTITDNPEFIRWLDLANNPKNLVTIIKTFQAIDHQNDEILYSAKMPKPLITTIYNIHSKYDPLDAIQQLLNIDVSTELSSKVLITEIAKVSAPTTDKLSLIDQLRSVLATWKPETPLSVEKTTAFVLNTAAFFNNLEQNVLSGLKQRGKKCYGAEDTLPAIIELFSQALKEHPLEITNLQNLLHRLYIFCEKIKIDYFKYQIRQLITAFACILTAEDLGEPYMQLHQKLSLNHVTEEDGQKWLAISATYKRLLTLHSNQLENGPDSDKNIITSFTQQRAKFIIQAQTLLIQAEAKQPALSQTTTNYPPLGSMISL